MPILARKFTEYEPSVFIPDVQGSDRRSKFGNIHIRSTAFALDGNSDSAGNDFRSELGIFLIMANYPEAANEILKETGLAAARDYFAQDAPNRGTIWIKTGRTGAASTQGWSIRGRQAGGRDRQALRHRGLVTARLQALLGNEGDSAVVQILSSCRRPEAGRVWQCHTAMVRMPPLLIRESN